MSHSKYTLIVESNRPKIIENAFKMAEVSFNNVSSISRHGNASNHSFIIAPNVNSASSEQIIFEVQEQQDFIDWCERENLKANKKVLKVKKIDL
mgnify:CR=1 FL=1